MRNSALKAGLASLLLLLASGCMQLRTHVKLHEDGSATITEHVRFSRRLLELGGGENNPFDIPSLLGKEAALERMAHMGKGIRLVSHSVHEAEAGSRESKTVYKIPDLNAFHYHNYLLMYGDRHHRTLGRFSMEPISTSSWGGVRAGDMAVRFHRIQRTPAKPKPKAKPADNAQKPTPPRPPTPLDHQIVRELRPAFKDMMKGFLLQLTFESYAPIRTGFGRVNVKRKQKYLHLIIVTDKQLGKHGSRLVDNEEVMLDLLRGDLGSRDMVAHVGGLIHFGSPHRRWTRSDMIMFPPSRDIFDKYLKGKRLFSNHKDKKGYAADFNKVGWKGGNGSKK